jgi:hypothetical protein
MTLFALISATTLALGASSASAATVPSVAPASSEAAVAAYVSRMARASGEEVVAPSVPIPSFSRQTGLACSACHTSFPQLNAFGRMFKLNGYTMTAAKTIDQKGMLRLGGIPPFSMMILSSFSSTKKAVPDQQNSSLAFPEQLSLFVGGAITPKIGTFLQLTYDPASGTIGMDNADIRYSNHATLGGHSVTWGLTLNNAPGVQDLWNSTPVWGFPFVGSPVAPGPNAATLIDGTLGQAVAGLGGYALWGNRLYTGVTFYRSAFQGGPFPVDGSAENAIQGVAPYWRVALQHNITGGQVMVGGYGMMAHLVPSGFTGTTDRYSDAAVDAQLDKTMPTGASFVAHGTWIYEHRHLPASVAAGAATTVNSNLSTARVDATYYTKSRLGLSAGLFSTTGDSDPLLYPAGDVTGNANGSPNSTGYIAQVSFMPWLNTRLGLQYVGYTKFNGASTNYDGAGRNASDNNTLYIMTWLVF